MMQLALVAATTACLPASAAWLEVCPTAAAASPEKTGMQAKIASGDGSQKIVRVRGSAPLAGSGCAAKEINATATEVIGLQAMTEGDGSELGDRFSFSGSSTAQGFRLREIAPGSPRRPSPTPAAPLQFERNLLADLQVQAFGPDGRVKSTRSADGVVLQCYPGQAPAGVRLLAPAYLPLAQSRLELSGHGSGKFDVLSVDQTQDAAGSGLALGSFEAAPVALRTGWDLPAAAYPEWKYWTIACPEGAAELHLDLVQLAPVSRPAPGRAAWVWQATQWQQRPAEIFAHAQKHGLATLFVTVPLRGGNVAQPQALTRFISRAYERGLAVWAVDGDPAMVLPAERESTLARARAYRRFNQSASPSNRLAGVQFDVEPYLLPNEGVAESVQDARYIELVKALHEELRNDGGPPGTGASAPPLEVVVPFWWAQKGALLQALTPWVSGLVVMDYRTRQEEIYQLAVPFLDWGAAHGKKVRIALEAGVIQPDTRYRYEKAASGNLWVVEVAGVDVLLVLKDARANPQARVYRLSGTHIIDGSATTFHADTSRLLALLPHLERIFSAWPSFGGIALHELRY